MYPSITAATAADHTNAQLARGAHARQVRLARAARPVEHAAGTASPAHRRARLTARGWFAATQH